MKPPVCMLAIDPAKTQEKDDVQVFISTTEGAPGGTIWCLSRRERRNLLHHKSPIVRMCFGGKAKMIAIYDSLGHLIVSTRDLANGHTSTAPQHDAINKDFQS